jgi:Lon protease-like protein
VRLQIFDPRYLQMLKDRAGNREFAIALISRGEEVGALATPFRVGTRVTYTETAPGNELIKLQATGVERLEFEAFDRESKPYLLARYSVYRDESEVSDIDDAPEMISHLESLAQRLKSLAQAAGQSLERLEEGLSASRESGDPELFSLFLCGCLSMPAIYQQRLLEVKSTRRRIEEALRLLEST